MRYSDSYTYRGDEIMFADEEAVSRYRIPEQVFRREVEEARLGDIRGFAWTPPSLWDLLIVAQDARYQTGDEGKLTAMVVTSGGIWKSQAVDANKARQAIARLNVYGQIFEAARSPTARDKQSGRHDRAVALLANVMKDAQLSKFISDFAASSLALRAPYSTSAFEAHVAGSNSQLQLEIDDKLRHAKRFCELVAELGISASFAAFPH